MSAAARRRRFFNPLREGVKPGAHWIEWAARAGYLAKGIVYGLVGLLAVQAAFTAAASPDTKDALAAIGSAPFGRVLLAAVAAGLACYAAWRVLQGVWDTEYRGRTWKGLAVRAGYVIAGLANVAIAAAAAMGAAYGGGSHEDRKRQAAAYVLSWPGGWVALLLGGLVVIGVGVGHFVAAYRARFMAEYDRTEMSDAERKLAKPVGRFGLAARGVTFCLIGLFLSLAAWRTNAGEVKGLGDAFNVLAAQPWGRLLFAAVALGFVAYGAYCVSRAKYKRIAVP